MKSGHNPIELWKAIHGGCWPGPPPDTRLTQQVNEVMSGLAMFNLATGFSNAQVARQARTLAVAGQKKAREHYDWDVIADRLIGVYEDAIRENSLRQ